MEEKEIQLLEEGHGARLAERRTTSPRYPSHRATTSQQTPTSGRLRAEYDRQAFALRDRFNNSTGT